MANLSDLLKKAEGKPRSPTLQRQNTDFGVKKTMQLMRESGSITPPVEEQLSQPESIDHGLVSPEKTALARELNGRTLLNASAASNGRAAKPLASDSPSLEKTDSRAFSNNADTMPTQIFSDSRHNADTVSENDVTPSRPIADTMPTQLCDARHPDSRHNADTASGTHASSNSAIADTMPTQTNLENNAQEQPSVLRISVADTEPTQVSEVVHSGSRHNADTIIDVKILPASPIADTMPTQAITILGSDSRHKFNPIADTMPTQAGRDKTRQPIADTRYADSRHNADKNPTQSPTQISSDSRHNSDDPIDRYRLLTGQKLRLLTYLLKECVRQHSNSIVTTYESLAQAATIPIGSVRTTTKRLREDGFLIIGAHGLGRGARIILTFDTHLIRASALDFLLYPTQNSPDSRHKADTEPDTKASSSSSSLNNTTTGKERKEAEVFQELETIELSGVEEFRISYGTLARCLALSPKLTIEDLKALVYRFGEYMKSPSVRKTVQNAPGFFISLAKQQGDGQAPLSQFELPEERLMRELLSQSKAAKTKKEALENEYWNMEFERWVVSLSASDRENLVPKTMFAGNQKVESIKLKEFFEANVKPEALSRLQSDALKT